MYPYYNPYYYPYYNPYYYNPYYRYPYYGFGSGYNIFPFLAGFGLGGLFF
jgi:hypothetical protein